MILSGGALFSSKKLTTFYLVVAIKRRSKTTKYTSKSNPPSKNVLKLTHALPGVALRVLGMHLHIFPINYAKKNFRRPAGGAGAPTAPLATPMPS